MTIWKNEGWDRDYIDIFEPATYKYLSKKVDNFSEYLSDHRHIMNNIDFRKHQLSDNSLFVLPVCKLFESVLYFIACESGFISNFNNGEIPRSIKYFYKKNRKNIEDEIRKINDDNLSNKIIDKLFSTVEDYSDRNEVLHKGSLLKCAEINSFDSIIIKIRDVVKVLIEGKIIEIRED